MPDNDLPKLPQKVIDAVEYIRMIMLAMTDRTRLYVFDLIEDGYCPHCGTNYLPCSCNNDE